jgi:hypothetical protein
MTTLTVMVVVGQSWYKRLVGKPIYVYNNGKQFTVEGSRTLHISKEHAVVTAVHYEDENDES